MAGEVSGVFHFKSAKPMLNVYDNWAKTYEDDLSAKTKTQNHIEIGEIVDKMVPDRESQILDIGAGTGLIGQIFAERGFKNIDAHDGSKEMLEIAKSKNIYRKVYHEILEPNQPSKVMPPDYDVLVSKGCFCPGHLNSDHFHCLLHLTKKNGLILITTRDEFLSYNEKEYPEWKYNLKEKMLEMEKEKKWKFLEKFKHEKYIEVKNEQKSGHTFVFRKL